VGMSSSVADNRWEAGRSALVAAS